MLYSWKVSTIQFSFSIQLNFIHIAPNHNRGYHRALSYTAGVALYTSLSLSPNVFTETQQIPHERETHCSGEEKPLWWKEPPTQGGRPAALLG